jgi:hypothetical protein
MMWLMEVFKLPAGGAGVGVGVGAATGVGVGVAWATLLPIPWHPETKSAVAKAALSTAPTLIRLAQFVIFVVPARMVCWL